MKRTVLVIIASMFGSTAFAQSSVYVKPHVRTDGTFVQGHMRTSPNSSTYDNWSTRPNYNPYTGVQGTRDPYRVPSFNRPSTRRSRPF